MSRLSQENVLLLHAALLEGEEACEAWRGWRSARTLETMAWPSRRLLPLVATNLAGRLDEETTRLRGAYAAAWYRNGLLLRSTARALETLAAAGLPALLVDATAVAVRFCEDGRLPALDCADVAVRAAAGRRGTDALAAAGWRVTAVPGRRAGAMVWPLADGSGHRLALHAGGVEADTWARAKPLEWSGARAAAPAAGDQLLRTIVRGAYWKGAQPLTWLSEAALVVLRAGEELDWEVVAAGAERSRTALWVATALECLVEALGAPVPSATLARLRAARSSRLERLAHGASVRAGRVTPLPLVLEHYRHLHRLDPSLGPAHFLAERLGAATRRELPGRLARSALRRLRHA